MAHERLPILRIIPLESQIDERFLIEDELNRSWNGEEFSHMHVPRIYANHNHAAIDIQEILKGHFVGVRPDRYVAPLVVDVYSHEVVNIVDIARHLSRASQLHLNTDKHGHGPSSSLLLPWIEWHRMRPITETTNG